MVYSQPIEPILNPKKLTIVGTGRLSKAVIRLLAVVNPLSSTESAQSSLKTVVYSRTPSEIKSLPPDISITQNINEAIYQSKGILLAVPSHAVEDIALQLGPHVLPDQIILLVSRGVTEGLKLPSDIIRQHTCIRKIGIIGGPLHVREIEAGRRINAIMASQFDEVIQFIRSLVGDSAISFNASQDVIGVQIVGAMANVAYIASGIADTFSQGDTARGVLIARGVIEAQIVGLANGAKAETFSGLPGLGELIPRTVASIERHIELGRAIGQGISLEKAKESISGHIEGITSAFEIASWAKAKNFNLPLISAVSNILQGNTDPKSELQSVLSMPLQA